MKENCISDIEIIKTAQVYELGRWNKKPVAMPILKINENAFYYARMTSFIEDYIYEVLLDAFESERILDIKSYDDYDNSIEFYIQEGATLTKTERKILKALGFSQCWLCTKDKDKNKEVHYSL